MRASGGNGGRVAAEGRPFSAAVPTRGRGEIFLYSIILGCICLIPAFRPGDTPFVCDEPLLIGNALQANAAHVLAPVGLAGSFGFFYGPQPTQIYQLLLLFTHDLLALVAIRAILTNTITAVSLVWLARSLKVDRWLVPAMLLSPFLWLFSRLLWDNTFLIPVASLAVAGYASFLTTRSPASLVLTVAAIVAMPLIHPMAAPLSAAIGGDLLLRNRERLWNARIGIGVVLLFAIFGNVGYAEFGIHRCWEKWQIHKQKMAAARLSPGSMPSDPAPPADNRPAPLTAAIFPLQVGRLLSGDSFHVDFQPYGRWTADVLSTTRRISQLGLLFVWAGMAISGARLAQAAVRRRPLNLLNTLGAIAWISLVLQMLMFGVMRLPPWTHYLNGMLLISVLFAWTALDAVRFVVLRRFIIGVWGLSLALLTACAAVQIHRNEGDRDHFGPSLANQLEIAGQLGPDDGQPIASDVPNYVQFPHNLQLLRRLLVQAHDGPQRAPDRSGKRWADLFISYRTPRGPDARVEITFTPR